MAGKSFVKEKQIVCMRINSMHELKRIPGLCLQTTINKKVCK